MDPKAHANSLPMRLLCLFALLSAHSAIGTLCPTKIVSQMPAFLKNTVAVPIAKERSKLSAIIASLPSFLFEEYTPEFEQWSPLSKRQIESFQAQWSQVFAEEIRGLLKPLHSISQQLKDYRLDGLAGEIRKAANFLQQRQGNYYFIGNGMLPLYAMLKGYFSTTPALSKRLRLLFVSRNLIFDEKPPPYGAIYSRAQYQRTPKDVAPLERHFETQGIAQYPGPIFLIDSLGERKRLHSLTYLGDKVREFLAKKSRSIPVKLIGIPEDGKLRTEEEFERLILDPLIPLMRDHLRSWGGKFNYVEPISGRAFSSGSTSFHLHGSNSHAFVSDRIQSFALLIRWRLQWLFNMVSLREFGVQCKEHEISTRFTH